MEQPEPQFVLVWVAEDENLYVGPFETRDAAAEEALVCPLFEDVEEQRTVEHYVAPLARPRSNR
jgi:hypothetical protein